MDKDTISIIIRGLELHAKDEAERVNQCHAQLEFLHQLHYKVRQQCIENELDIAMMHVYTW